MPPPMIPVKSSNVAGFAYTAKTRTLWIWFLSGNSCYLYENVPASVAAELRRRKQTGESIGSYVSAQIVKPKQYPYTKVS